MLHRPPILASVFVASLICSPASTQGRPVRAPRTGEETTLRRGFASPPPEARLRCYWWWLNGNTTEETITNDLTEMSRKGFGGVLLVDANGSNQGSNEDVPAGPLFGSPAWVRLYVHALQVAASLHLEVTLNITSGWNLGGPDVTAEDSSKLLTWSRQIVDEKGFDGVLPMPPMRNEFYRRIAVLAYPLTHGPGLPATGGERAPIRDLRYKNASAEMSFSMPPTEPLLDDVASTPGEQDMDLKSIVDIGAQVDAGGRLRWMPPSAGAWEVLSIGYTDSDARVSTASGKWQGRAIDYLDRNAFDTYWQHTVAPLLEASRPYLKTTLVNLATDSWELGGTNWTGRFREEFKARRGYDPVLYLPIVTGRIVQDRATSTRFMNDLRRTVGDLITDHYDHFAERAKEFGLGIQCESGGPHGAPIDALETFRSSAVPQTEYWAQSVEHRSTDEDRFFTKEAASAASIYGKKFVAQEGMTSIGPQWSESLATDLKPSFDQALTEGMNRLVWHQFTSSPKSFGLPGIEYFAGTHLNPNVTWWDQGGAFFMYLNRSQFLLQQGHAVDDVLYFSGDDVPNFVRLKRDDPAHVLPGYDYDVTNEDALLRTLDVRGGRISSPAGNNYKLLVMPRGRRLSLASLERIASYIHQGGAVSGETPLAPTGLVSEAAARRFAELSTAVWGGCGDVQHPYGAGTVFCTADAREALKTLKVTKDFEESSGLLDYVHRVDGTTDTYFVRNGSSRVVDVVARFRVARRVPEIWNAVDGSVETETAYAGEDGRTNMPLHLAAYGSVFVVFSRPAALRKANVVENKAVMKVHSEDLPASRWTIQFQADRGAPGGVRSLQSFESWASSAEAGVRYFSGTATYRSSFNVKRTGKERVFVTLTDLHEICTVRVNGKVAGTIWAMPYRLDITDSLKNGENSLALDVTNLWPNRIIGDAQPGAALTYTTTNIRKYKAGSPLLASGLIGPVSIESVPVAAHGVEREKK